MTPAQIAQQKAIEQANAELKQQGGATKTDLGEPLRWSPAFEALCEKKYGLDHPDLGYRAANWEKFKKTSDFRRATTYVNRFI